MTAPITWGIVGFGEAGSTFAQYISSKVDGRVLVTDPILNQSPLPAPVQARLSNAEVSVVPDVPSLVTLCDVILSLVTASVAPAVAEKAGQSWRHGLFIDFNTTSPVQKQKMVA